MKNILLLFLVLFSYYCSGQLEMREEKLNGFRTSGFVYAYSDGDIHAGVRGGYQFNKHEFTLGFGIPTYYEKPFGSSFLLVGSYTYYPFGIKKYFNFLVNIDAGFNNWGVSPYSDFYALGIGSLVNLNSSIFIKCTTGLGIENDRYFGYGFEGMIHGSISIGYRI